MYKNVLVKCNFSYWPSEKKSLKVPTNSDCYYVHCAIQKFPNDLKMKPKDIPFNAKNKEGYKKSSGGILSQ